MAYILRMKQGIRPFELEYRKYRLGRPRKKILWEKNLRRAVKWLENYCRLWDYTPVRVYESLPDNASGETWVPGDVFWAGGDECTQ